MATLSAPQIAYIRAKSGDGCEIVSDETLQIYYDAAESNLDCTIASVLEDMWAAATPGASKLTDFGTTVDTSEADHVKALLDYWQGRCGNAGSGLTTGVISLGIDYTENDLESAS